MDKQGQIKCLAILILLKEIEKRILLDSVKCIPLIQLWEVLLTNKTLDKSIYEAVNIAVSNSAKYHGMLKLEKDLWYNKRFYN